MGRRKAESFPVGRFFLRIFDRLLFGAPLSVGRTDGRPTSECIRNSRPSFSLFSFLFRRDGSIIGAIKMGEEPKALFDHNISSDGRGRLEFGGFVVESFLSESKDCVGKGKRAMQYTSFIT